MATRRVKRTKRQSHHGRKTKRHHKRHTRITKRQRGGMFKGFFKAIASNKLNAKGGPRYGGIEVFQADTDTGKRYYIGNRPINE